MLPEITDEHLRQDVGTPGDRIGDGREQFQAAAPYWNSHDYDKALSLLESAIELELTMPYESMAHDMVGQIHVINGDLDAAVRHFVKCLEVPVRSSDALWSAATRLHLIYDEAGRHDEAEALGSLAAAVNTRGLALSAEGENEIRELVRRQSAAQG